MQFRIENMTCGGCARGVTRAIQSVDPQASVDADPPNRRIEVQSTASPEQLRAALANAGFPASDA
ncbi:MAG: heavy-metal-associated domain-containing protein [Steroidobacteraceae bacterium]